MENDKFVVFGPRKIKFILHEACFSFRTKVSVQICKLGKSGKGSFRTLFGQKHPASIIVQEWESADKEGSDIRHGKVDNICRTVQAVRSFFFSSSISQ